MVPGAPVVRVRTLLLSRTLDPGVSELLPFISRLVPLCVVPDLRSSLYSYLSQKLCISS